MNNFGATPNILIAASVIAWGLLYFIGLSIPEHHDFIKLGYDTCFFLLVLGYTLRRKKVQQIIGLFFIIILYNLDLFKVDISKIPETSTIYYFATHYSFYVVVIACLLLFPTLFNNYKLTPLTNETKYKDSTIILTSLTLTVLFQTTARLVLM